MPVLFLPSGLFEGQERLLAAPSLTFRELSWKLLLRVGRGTPSPSPGSLLIPSLSIPHLLQDISSSLPPSLPFADSPEGMGQGKLLEFGVYFDF